MTNTKRIALDANILIRAVFGTRVRNLLEAYGDYVAFCAPDVCFAEAESYIPGIATKRGIAPADGLAFLSQLSGIVQPIAGLFYEEHGSTARERIGHRDMDDWPVVATALLLNCPTEDHDFFGTGIPTWTSHTVEQYLRAN
jgi:predicted nucleic acid-binding protein